MSALRDAVSGSGLVKVLSVVGARPQFVKAAPVSRALRRDHTEILVHTGQHYDDAMSAAFFRDLQIPEPDINLEVGSGSHAGMTANILRSLEPVILDHEPDGVLIYGDTNSTLAAAVVTCKIAYPGGDRPWLVHVEAGLRSGNPRMPEERNRIVADHLSDVLLAPTAAAMRHLEREGLGQRATLVGDVMVDSHAWASQRAPDHLPVAARGLDQYILLTMHRAENVDDPDRFRPILEGLAIDLPVIFPVHPRTRVVLEKNLHGLPANVVAIDPVGYLEMVALEAGAYAIATDSGGVQKEAYLAGVPCITLRSETEWVETTEAGWNRVVDADPRAVTRALADPTFMDRAKPRPALYGDGHAAARIVTALEAMPERSRASVTA